MIKRLALLIFVAAMFVACGPENGPIEGKNSVGLTTNVVDATASSQWLTINTKGEWNAEIIYDTGEHQDGGEGYGEGEETEKWAVLAESSGTGDALIRLSYLRNTEPTERTLDIVVTFETGSPIGVTLTQEAETDPQTTENNLSLESNSVPHQAGNQTITITSDVAWTATLLYDSNVAPWAEFEGNNFGTGDKLIDLSWEANNTPHSRSVIVEVAFDDGETLLETMTQTGVGENAVQLDTQEIAYNSTSNVAVTITSELSWEVTLQYGSGASGWANISKSEGSGNDVIQLTPTENSLENSRTVTVSVTFAGEETKTATLTQAGTPGTPPSTNTPKWTEVPAVVMPNDEDYYLVTHYAAMNGGGQARNYTMLYDATMYVARWIAYPMSRGYASGSAGGRNEDWKYDPKIPQDKQVNLSKSYGVSSDAGIYSRGHQVASSDRQSTKEQNRQTFYFTNMTPQKQDFNGVIWNYLEQNIQDLAKNIADTLWCVTGPVFQTIGGSEPVKYISKDGKQCPVPNYYYKVIIRKSGNTYKGIGFWFGHNYAYSIPHFKDGPSMTDVKKIREIEALTGINFYTNLSQTDQDAAENQTIDQSYWSSLFGK